jgi:serine protease AprX
MRKTRVFFNVVFILILVSAALGNTSMVAQAGKKTNPKVDPNLLQLANAHPDFVFPVIVQKNLRNKNLPDDDPETAVAKVNGKIHKNKKMSFIASFSADLTGKRIAKLATNPKVRWISLDAPLFTSDATTATVLDSFTALAFDGNNGTANWSNAWQELGESDGPTAGNVQVINCGGGNCLDINGSPVSIDGRGVSREANLETATSATLSFGYERVVSASNTGSVLAQVSADGGASWTPLATYTLDATDSDIQSAQFDISSYISTNTQVRFIGSGTINDDATINDDFYINNVQIQYTTPLDTPPAAPPALDASLLNAYDRSVGADKLWTEPPYLDGSGVTVAVVDSGITPDADLQVSGSSSRITAATTLIANDTTTQDGYGHGTHVAGIIAGNGNMSDGQRMGIAPNVNLVNVKVSYDNGMVLGSDLVAGLQWVFDNQAAYNIKVVNISINSTVAESYETSPIDAAVEMLWFKGIVVVVSSGNSGTGAVYPPANDPFVITVGATDDMGTASISDDAMAAFSTYGITEDGFSKPDLVAPGRNIISLLASTSDNAYVYHPANRVDDKYYRMSGTSMAAPVVSGAAALMLQSNPTLNPDQVKYRLLETANKDWAGYDSSSAGAGYLDAYSAVQDDSTAAANLGLQPSQMLSTGDTPIAWDSVGWNSVGWNSVGWNSVGWNSVGWNSVGWNSVGWNSDYWDQ